MQGAFAIQAHQTAEGLHFDLMLEQEQALATFQLPEPPERLAIGESLAVPRLFDHRKAYLAYEGPVSGNRGSVRIHDSGTYRGQPGPGGGWRVELMGRRLRGWLALTPQEPPFWRLERLAPGSVEPAERPA